MSKQKNIDTRKKGGRPKLESYNKRRHQHKVSYNDTEQEIAEAKAKEHNRTLKKWKTLICQFPTTAIMR